MRCSVCIRPGSEILLERHYVIVPLTAIVVAKSNGSKQRISRCISDQTG